MGDKIGHLDATSTELNTLYRLIEKAVNRGVDCESESKDLAEIVSLSEQMEESLSDKLFLEMQLDLESCIESLDLRTHELCCQRENLLYSVVAGFLGELVDSDLLTTQSMLETVRNSLSKAIDHAWLEEEREPKTNDVLSDWTREGQYSYLWRTEGCENLTALTMILGPLFKDELGPNREDSLIAIWMKTQLMNRESFDRNWNTLVMDIAILGHSLICPKIIDDVLGTCWQVMENMDLGELF
tara:strand:- start:5637 stop:6362 length:726 start_codon:yes stop_codon:yes gene_type:complete